MIKILNRYEQDGFQIIEYTIDGTTISHTVKTPILVEVNEPQATIEEQILAENQYQTALLEMQQMLGGK